MENAIYLGEGQLGIEVEKFDRIYIGEEYCDRYFLTIRKKILSYLRNLNYDIQVSIVLPIINESSLPEVIEFIEEILVNYNEKMEFICNDIGSVNYLISKEYPNIVSGRFLTRAIIGYYLSNEHEEYNYFLKYIKRIEVDASGLNYIRRLRNINISYYLNNISLGISNNRCLNRTLTNQFPEKNICSYQCSSRRATLGNRYLNGSYEFLRNTIIQKDNSKFIPKRVDRVVQLNRI